MRAARSLAHILLPVSALLAGCAEGPYYDVPLQLPASGPPGGRLVVGDFYYQVQHVPRQGPGVDPLHPSEVLVMDIAPEVRKALAPPEDASIEVRRATARDLGPGDALVRGFVFDDGGHGKHIVGPVLLSILTGFLVGGFFPYPFEIRIRCRLPYQINLTRAGGSSWAQKGVITPYYRTRWLWGLSGACKDILATSVAEHIAGGIGRARDAAPP